MKITPIEHNLNLAVSGPKRSKGLHMSDIYGSYYAAMDKRFRDNGQGPDKVKMETGLAFEDVLEPALAERLFGARPKEMRCTVDDDGRTITIYFSPDYAFLIDGETVLGEFKLTWYSSKGAPRGKKFQKWITQIMLYCHELNLTKARLYVLFVNGDYKPPAPKLVAWELEFTQSELDEEWDIMMRHAKKVGLFDEHTGENVQEGRPRKPATANHRKHHRGSRRG